MQSFINPLFVIFVPLRNDNMVNYTFAMADGRRVTEYRPFSISYAVRQTPCLHAAYYKANDSRAEVKYGAATDKPDLLGKLTGQKLVFDGYSLSCLRQLVTERIELRDRNRKDLSEKLSDIAGYLSICRQLPTPPNQDRANQLERSRMDLEKQVRDENLTLWRDVAELRKELILAGKQYEAGQIRAELLGSFAHDEHKRHDNPGLSGEMPGFASYSGIED